jgi:hypothetical protein
MPRPLLLQKLVDAGVVNESDIFGRARVKGLDG